MTPYVVILFKSVALIVVGVFRPEAFYITAACVVGIPLITADTGGHHAHPAP